MNESKKLWAVYQAERKLRGLQSRLQTAERFLAEQERQLVTIDSHHGSLASQLRQIEASIKECEAETTRIDARIEKLREEMNVARTNKEYQAFLVEINALKIERGRAEEETLSHMEKADAMKSEIERCSGTKTERKRVRDVAKQDRDTRHDEIKDRLSELRAERDTLAAQVEPRILAELVRLLEERDEDAMAGIEIIDRRRQEINCAACMMSLPVELLSQLLRGKLTSCSNCGCFLHLDDETATALQPASSKR